MTTSEPRIPRAPAGLGARGRRFWRRTLAENELTNSEMELLEEVCRTMDDLDELRNAVKSEGVTVEGSAGQRRTHPAYVEIRQQRANLGKLLAQLAIPDEQGQAVATMAEARALRAANTRWGPHRAKAAGDG